jgi:hypothetical protein
LIGLPVLLLFFWWANGSRPDNNERRTSDTSGKRPGPGRNQKPVTPAPVAPAPRTAAEKFFASKVRPILDGKCFKCHGGKKVRGGLRLDSRSALLKGGDSGPAVVPGDADKSRLIQAIRYKHEDFKMPPGKQLPPAVVADLVAWVKDGAVWPEQSSPGRASAAKRWAFTPIPKVVPPADPAGWSANPIDRFVRARLREHGLQPAGPADKRTLIRRVTFDLVGLPPTPAEVDDFLADRSPAALATVVDRLLASPQYGERWGRHWLDVVRYADTGGFEVDHLYANAWRFRDYVIRSLNADKPFDRFLQEQVAGDELWPANRDAVLASRLYGLGPVQSESAMVSNQLEYEWLTDAADTTGAAFLGLTFGCARCHDHKYDPLTQKDYFAMQAIFAASDRPYPAKVRLTRLKALNGLLAETPLPKKLEHDPRCTLRTEDQVGLRLFHRQESLAVHRLHRGELSKPREVAEPAFPAVLLRATHPPDFAGVPPTQRRATLARWLTAPDNPLTARVLVNRVWSWHFGQAIVRTPNDFGAQGEPPTHPELLDWLARDFREHGWSLKHLHRRIVLSSTYRMRSAAGDNGQRLDPENRWLWHFPRRRLEGEAIRDAMLACAGTLRLKAFGPPVVPPLSRQELTGLFDAKGKWPVTKDAAEHSRRSVYLLVRRTFVYPLFAAFDPPEVMASCPQRARTVVPTQALTLFNSPLVRDQAAAFARRLRKECGDKPEEIVSRAWLLAFGRPITQAESTRTQTFLRQRTAAAQGAADQDARTAPAEAALTELCLALFNTNEFIAID